MTFSLQILLLDREHQFHSPVQVPRHPVGAREIHLGISSVIKDECPAVLEIAVENGNDANVVAQFRELRVAGSRCRARSSGS